MKYKTDAQSASVRLSKKLISENVPIAYVGAIINRPAVKSFECAGIQAK